MSQSNKNILFVLTGSIACYKACHVLSKLKQNGYNLKVVMSPSSLEFIGAATIEGLTGTTPITDMYSASNVMDHINLMRWADLIIAAPATANYINKIAHGLGDDLLTTLFLAHDFSKPFLIAPAMNTKMYMHPTTQESINKLKKMSISILETASGVLACGEIGSGRLLEPELIYNEIVLHLQSSSAAPASREETSAIGESYRVLITGGGTSEAIDDVRSITNISTGKTAAEICNVLANTGLQVTYLHAKNAQLPSYLCELQSFVSSQDLENLLQQQLTQNKFNLIIHAAAVSDYSVVANTGKINSELETVQLTLKRNKKLINEIKKLSPHSQLVGFKLTSGAPPKQVVEKVNLLIEKAKCDLVVHNDWQDLQNGLRKFTLFSRHQSIASEAVIGVDNLAKNLFQKFIMTSAKENI